MIDAMHQKLAAALDKLPFEIPQKRLMMNPPKSPSQRNSRQLDPSMIQAMFPDAAAALAHKRSLLTSNRNSMNGLPTTTAPLIASEPRSPGIPTGKDKDGWPISSSVESPITVSKRPASADLSNWQGGTGTTPTSQPKSPAAKPPVSNSNVADSLTSPFGIGGSSWASLVNTPIVPMFSNPYTTSQRGDTDLAGSTAMKLAAWNANANRSSVSGGVINLDDVRKFRRGRTQTPQTTPNEVPPTPPVLRETNPNIVMYDENGHLLQFASQLNQAQLNQLRAAQATLGTATVGTPTSRSRPTSPYAQYATFPSIRVSSPVLPTQPFYQAFDTSPTIPSEFTQGYLSDHTSDRRGSPLHMSGRPRAYGNNTRRSSSTTKHQEDPTDPNLLNDIPGWLRSLRLHKYTENLSDVKGGVMALAQLTDEDLEKRGVSAVGARRKLLKCFEQVKTGPSQAGEGQP
jgi:hypothetical protein